MNGFTRARRGQVALVRNRTRRLVTAVLLAATAGCGGGPPAAPPPPTSATGPTTPAAGTTATTQPRDLPRSMAALGDSTTRAFLVCAVPGDCPEASWATGTYPDVGSHAARIGDLAGRPITARNLAVSGARVAGLAGQVAEAVAMRPVYVTVLIGVNDACRQSEDEMTPVAEYTRDFDRALDALVHGLPEARVLVVSIPDLLRLWEVGKDVAAVRETWDRSGVCRSMLGDAADRSAGADARRSRVRDRVVAYNDAMAAACARHRTCRWDGGAVFGYDFPLAEVSPRDYWHPSREGQRALAEVSWRAGYWG